ncbi:MAG: winged helix-turn-helix domain-containing protein [Candidatus Hodarchaeota archaeon]
MPEGILVAKWDDVTGVVLEAKHPETVEIGSQNLMRIFTSHAVGEGQAGFLTLSLEEANLNIASYFTGVETTPQYFIALVLGIDEDARMYEAPLLDVAEDLLSHIDSPKFPEVLGSTYDRLLKMAALTDEQQLALLYKDKLHILLHNKLTEGPMPLIELKYLLEEESGRSIRSIDALISPLTRNNFVILSWVAGMPGQCAFLVRDFLVMRRPAGKSIKIAEQGKPSSDMARSYLKATQDYFAEYEMTEEDSMKISQLMLDPDIYSILLLLREEPRPVADIPKELEIKASSANKLIKRLEESNVILRIKDDKWWAFLLSDIGFPTFFPEYLLETIRSRFAEKTISSEMALKHLDLLQENYS